MSSENRRRTPPALKRTASPDSPRYAASVQAGAAMGVNFWFSGDPLAALELDTVTEEDIGDLSRVFPTEEQLATLRDFRPGYQLPPLEERTRRFLSEFLLCSALLEYEERSLRMQRACGLDATPFGNVEYWKTRCRAVAALIHTMPPSREKSLLTLRYINGHSIEASAPMLGVSRRTAYRIHKRALLVAASILRRRSK